MKKLGLFLVMVVMGCATCFAQFSVKGSVVDKKSSENLPFVNVALLRTSDSLFVRGASTNNPFPQEGREDSDGGKLSSAEDGESMIIRYGGRLGRLPSGLGNMAKWNSSWISGSAIACRGDFRWISKPTIRPCGAALSN